MKYAIHYDVYTPWIAEVEASSPEEAMDKFNRGETLSDTEQADGEDHIILVKEER